MMTESIDRIVAEAPLAKFASSFNMAQPHLDALALFLLQARQRGVVVEIPPNVADALRAAADAFVAVADAIVSAQEGAPSGYRH
jgi:hypothetical protein